MRIHDYLDYWASRLPDEVCITDGAESLTWAQMRDWSGQIGQWLADQLEPEARFSVLSKNSFEIAGLYFGASRAGVVPVPLNTRLAPPEWAFILEDTGVDLLVAEEEFADAIDGLRGGMKPIGSTVVIGSAREGWRTFAGEIARYPSDPPDRAPASETPVYQMYTSGTTGRPKGAVISQGAAVSGVTQLQAAIGLHRDRMIMVMPLFHSGAAIILFANAATGTTTRIMRDFNPVEVLRIMREEGITITIVVAAMLQALLKQPGVRDVQYPELRLIAYGAGPMPPQLLREAIEVFGCGFFQSYGQTETAACTTGLYPEDHERGLKDSPELLLSCGRPVLATEIRIVDSDDQDVAVREMGEVLVRGPQVMQGYWGQPDATAEALRGGWMHTGDVAYRDEEGFIYICDRVKDMIISGGENIYAREVEDVLLSLPGVAEAAVIGVPDEQWGEVVKAILVKAPDSDITAEEIIEHCRSELAGYKRPHSVDFVPALPRNVTGKVLKRELRQPFWEGRARAIN